MPTGHISTLPAGDNSILATYAGDGNYAGSSTTFDDYVSPCPTTVTLAANSGTVAYGDPCSFNATVAGQSTASSSPSEYVDFYNGSSYLGKSLLSGSVATLTLSDYAADWPIALSPGDNTIHAYYEGDSNYLGNYSPNTGSASTDLWLGPMATSTAVTSTSTVYGQPMTFAATVTDTQSPWWCRVATWTYSSSKPRQRTGSGLRRGLSLMWPVIRAALSSRSATLYQSQGLRSRQFTHPTTPFTHPTTP